MKRKKSSFLAFITSLIPGAGEMYLGFMKKGLSLMLIFWGIIALAIWIGMETLFFSIPIIWFYSFFETHNLRGLPQHELNAVEDNYFLIPDIDTDKMKFMQSKYRNIFALVLIVIGASILWNNMYGLFEDILPQALSEFISSIGHYFPQIFIAFAIIALGLYLIRGKKIELDMNDQLTMLEDKEGEV